MLEITVYGSPAPQGSKRFVGLSGKGHGKMIESSKAVKPWREAVKYAAVLAVSGTAPEEGGGITGPVNVEMSFTLAKPKSAPKQRRVWPDRKPDLSKLVRSTEDALTDVGAWEDDARVVLIVARKLYTGDDGAMMVPGAIIRITSAQEALRAVGAI